MPMYSRSDVLEVKCEARPGTSHVRPRRGDGEPIPVWGVDCPPCERGHLVKDPHWAKTKGRIPLTPDEKEEAEEAVREAARLDSQLKMIEARERLARVREYQESGELMAVSDEDVVVTTADDNRNDAGVPDKPAVSSSADVGASYRAMTKPDLADLARDRGMAVSGNKDDLVSRHVEYDQGRK